MNKKQIIVGLLFLCLLAARPFALQAQQAADPTATPDAEGVIYAEVRPDDSLWAIAARSGIRLETLLSLNDITEESIIRVGELLIIGYVTPPATATAEPTLTPTLSPPTPTSTPPPPPQTAVCLRAYVDQNQNGVHDPDEKLRPAVAFTIYNESAVVANYVTNGVAEPHCLALEPGAYQITRSTAQNERLTNDGNLAVVLQRGDVLDLAFGGFIGPTATPPTAAPPTAVPPTTHAPPTETAVPETIGVSPSVPPTPPKNTPDEQPAENGRFPSWLNTGFLLLFVLMAAGVIFFVVWVRKQ
jgi:hypothetical protein